MQIKRKCCQLLMAVVCLFCSVGVLASNSSLTIPFANDTIIIDGELNDKLWQQANSIDLNIVNSPWENKPSPVKTQAKIIENGEYIYIAFIAEDPRPRDIIASLGDRDSKWADDLVGIKLDTFNTRRLNYEFLVNPLGVQIDLINNEITGELNEAWDGIWHSYGKITDKGYQVEIAIPYRILNFAETELNKTWAIELYRFYPRDTKLRISHIPLSRDNICRICQASEIIGFKTATAGKKIMLTPTLVALKDETRDIYDTNSDWRKESDLEPSLDFRWGINANTLFNATLNPDFSTVESDAGQLSINKTFSLYYQEKRQFFTENSDYFSTNYDLVYTRNIADPEYGAKLTGSQDNHSYGVFVANDTETNFIVPGNTNSYIESLNTDSRSTALRYRYDANDELSIGAISTLRTADNYHNYVFGIDGKYKFDDSNRVLAQWLNSDTEHLGKFSDRALKLNYQHDSADWAVNIEHQDIGANFRADLGYMPFADYQAQAIQVDRLFYGEQNDDWQDSRIIGKWQIKHSEKGELIEKNVSLGASAFGPMLSLVEVFYTQSDKVGLQQDLALQQIDGNTTLFKERYIDFFAEAQPFNNLYVSSSGAYGKKIDYANNRLGNYKELSANLTYNVNKHLEIDFYHTYAALKVAGEKVYDENLTELRVNYQFNVRSYIKLNLVYANIDRNPDNNPLIEVSKRNRDLSTQLIYAYKINPQTVFYLGYSDYSYQDDYLLNLKREQRTLFTKISYAWMS